MFTQIPPPNSPNHIPKMDVLSQKVCFQFIIFIDCLHFLEFFALDVQACNSYCIVAYIGKQSIVFKGKLVDDFRFVPKWMVYVAFRKLP